MLTALVRSQLFLAPHGLCITHAATINEQLLAFLKNQGPMHLRDGCALL